MKTKVPKASKLREYHGPSGPSDTQVENNNNWLKEQLMSRRIKVEEFDHPEYGPSLKVVGHIVGYDRWGFSAEHPSKEGLDNASGKETLAYFVFFHSYLVYSGKEKPLA